MNLGEAKTRAIKLINEYSNNGALIPVASNRDYTLRMNALADDAQREISDKVSIDGSTEYVQQKGLPPGYNSYDLPADFRSIRYVQRNERAFYDFTIEGGKFKINKRHDGTFTLYYAKYPTEITDATLDSYTFEIDLETHRWIPYYIGGMVVADENSEISNKLLNIYYEGIGGLSKRRTSGPRTVANTMGW
ncbi:hypothetical protein [Cohnella sp. JJ-181]|uniref:phage adaptor protein n=1 Tax=Cohnella rhizoplanae TaxID=2974897 RepID=UPI0022FFB4BC|nr:hypothetical protein [Cohnella sp. JJ-181]CAI6073698.1 hypothetical protein COHCIP112018_02396 [Cohnella sp. JJ-181]